MGLKSDKKRNCKMAYKPLSQTVDDDDIYANPSSEAVFELAKLKADVDLGNLSLSGVEGQVLTLGASGPYWEDVAASGGGGSAEYPPQEGNAGKFLQTDGSDVSWQAVTGFEPEISLTADRVVISNASGKLAVSSVTPTTLGYLDVESSVQTQLNGKEPTLTKGNLTESTSSVLTITGGTGSVIGSGTSIQVKQSSSTISGFLSSTDWSTFNGKQAAITGAATTITSSDLTVSRAVISNASGKIAVSSVTDTELGYLSGTTSSVQTQLSARVPFTTATVSTTNATETTLETIGTTSNTTLGIECKVAARRTGGTAGATGDAAYYILKARAKNISGTVTLSTVTSTEFEDQSGWNADLSVSGTNVLLRVTGATNNNIDWKSTTTTIQV